MLLPTQMTAAFGPATQDRRPTKKAICFSRLEMDGSMQPVVGAIMEIVC